MASHARGYIREIGIVAGCPGHDIVNCLLLMCVKSIFCSAREKIIFDLKVVSGYLAKSA
jgi:hypothetical protein